MAAQPSDPGGQRIGRLIRLDRLHIAARLAGVTGRLAAVEIDRQGDVAFLGELRGNRLDLIVKSPPFVDQEDRRSPGGIGQCQRGSDRATGPGGDGYLLQVRSRRPRQRRIGEDRRQWQRRRALENRATCVHGKSLNAVESVVVEAPSCRSPRRIICHRSTELPQRNTMRAVRKAGNTARAAVASLRGLLPPRLAPIRTW